MTERPRSLCGSPGHRSGVSLRRVRNVLSVSLAEGPILDVVFDQRDEQVVRTAERCRDLVDHFGGGRLHAPPVVEARPVAPRVLGERDRVLYEVVALSCVTETLSTALLGVLVERAQDPLAKSVLHSILCDEIGHSRLGWAYLAEEYARGARDPVSEWLHALLCATLPNELFTAAVDATEFDRALAGFGSLEHAERQRIVLETLSVVIFPGLERFGIDTRPGRSWLSERFGALRL